ncbi:adenylate/guanylate cyclase domain-containing protein [Pelagibius sp. 7325]|uniref:adenylate/guanylate cyclase domain-containing protein n=1 Tax=Pelagibius sp. 7325 TaxID=3131994 RepID=UPI0030EEFE4C
MEQWRPALLNFLKKYSSDPDGLFRALTEQGIGSIAQYRNGEIICSAGDPADCVWLIVEGGVSVQGDEKDSGHIKDRGAGSLIGEQGVLMARSPTRNFSRGTSGRTATLKAHGFTRLFRIDEVVIEKLSAENQAAWYELLAHVLNEKLAEATHQRGELIEQRDRGGSMLSRFCDKEALGLARAAFEDQPKLISNREVVVWFSDLAGFSGWATGRDSQDVSKMAAELMGLQVRAIRRCGGEIDKLMGDGLMAFWLCDGQSRSGAPLAAYRCAHEVLREFNQMKSELGAPELGLRIGLHKGPAAFGDFGTEERITITLLGETVNLASRFEQLREKDCPGVGPIRISEAVHSCIAADIGKLESAKGVRVKKEIFDVFWSNGDCDGVES